MFYYNYLDLEISDKKMLDLSRLIRQKTIEKLDKWFRKKMEFLPTYNRKHMIVLKFEFLNV